MNAASGPAYFKVWAKNGIVTEYGASPTADSNSNALIKAFYPQGGVQFAQVWAAARATDVAGNSMSFRYNQRDVEWGSNGAYVTGHEWNVSEIQYGANKLVFDYDERSPSSPQDISETYNRGVKNLSVRRLRSIASYINSPETTHGAGALAVATTTYALSYDQGPITRRSRLSSVKQCAGGPTSTVCMPATTFTYTSGGDDRYVTKTDIGPLAGQELYYETNNYNYNNFHVFPGDLNGDGKSDVLALASRDTALNALWWSNGDGTFTKAALNLTENMAGSSCLIPILIDFNKDGLTDIFRYRGAVQNHPMATPPPCDNTLVHKMFINNGDGTFTGYPITGVDPQNRTAAITQPSGTTWDITQGSMFYVLDVDGDGIPDIVTTIFPAVNAWVIDGPNPNPCAEIVCTRVFRGVGVQAGNYVFTEIPTNLANTSIYSFPMTNGFSPRSVDIDGDGLQDIVVNTGSEQSPTPPFAARSLGNGNFDLLAGPLCDPASTVPCVGVFLDYNGSGRSSLLLAGSSASTNALYVGDLPNAFSKVQNSDVSAAGNDMQRVTTTYRIVNKLVTAFDANRDGREDLLIYDTDAAQNKLLLSNGDGTFSASQTFDLTSTALYSNNGSGWVLRPYFGDFTGNGATEIFLVKQAIAPNGTKSIANLLIKKADQTPPDLLLSVKPGAGALTTFSYVATGQASGAVAGDSLSPRYRTDRGTPNAATGNAVDSVYSGNVVRSVTTESGVGGQSLTQEFAYAGLKADTNGRGLLGFREVKSQALGGDGVTPITTVSRYAQDFPYTGELIERATYRASMGSESEAVLLTRESIIYCDQTILIKKDEAESTKMTTAISTGRNCPSSSPIHRPYPLRIVKTSKDLNGKSGPTVTIRNATAGYPMTPSGDPQLVSEATTVTNSPSGNFTRETTNAYAPDDTTCSSPTDCKWILGRVSRVTVSRTAPSTILATSAGAGLNATTTAGGGVQPAAPVLSPQVLAAILALLLDD